MTKRITIRDVAVKAGVSYQTISNVLNNNPNVGEDTRAHVRTVIAELGYQPSHAARTLRSTRTGTIAAIVPGVAGLTEPFWALFLAGLSDVLRGARHDLLTHTLESDNPEELGRFQSLFQQRRIDGAVVACSGLSDEVFHTLASWPYPMVAFERFAAGSTMPFVWAHFQEGMLGVMRHLVATGRRRIAYVHGNMPSAASSAAARLSGYRQGLLEAGLPLDPELVVDGGWSYHGGLLAADRLLARPERLDAVVCANDRMAVGVLQGVKRHGLQVPHDLAVTGFDDFEFAQYTDPQLTTVHLPVTDMAARAAHLLLLHIEGSLAAEDAQVVVPVHLVLRGSA